MEGVLMENKIERWNFWINRKIYVLVCDGGVGGTMVNKGKSRWLSRIFRMICRSKFC